MSTMRVTVQPQAKFARDPTVTVAVLDTGVDATHPDLQGNIAGGLSFVTPREDPLKDLNGHGTHISGES